jgi:hypothetical protein
MISRGLTGVTGDEGRAQDQVVDPRAQLADQLAGESTCVWR